MTNDGTWTYTYDNEGSLTQKTKGTNLDTWNYGYDNLNRLTSATEINAGATVQQLTFKYDVFGNRIDAENTTTTISHFAYDGANAWADFNSSNVLQTRRLYTDATDALFARISSGGTAAWYLTDRLGSVRDIANNTTGTSIDHLDYDGFGNVSNETNTTNGDRYKFTAREFDSQTGLQYNRARYYDPKPGRWTSQDPIGFDAGDNDLYRYVRNDPTRAVDPNGLEEFNLGTNKYGEFSIEMNQLRVGDKAGMRIKITFAPEPTEVNSQDIAFVQVGRIVEYDTLRPIFTSEAERNRKVSGGFSLDQFNGLASGWYGFQNNNTYNDSVTSGRSPQNYRKAVLKDTPNTELREKLRFEFVTAVIADEGPDQGKIYGAVNWAFWLGTDGVAHPYEHELLNEVPDRWIDAVKEWNAQATDCIRRYKHHENQRPLGPFKGVSVKPTTFMDFLNKYPPSIGGYDEKGSPIGLPII